MLWLKIESNLNKDIFFLYFVEFILKFKVTYMLYVVSFQMDKVVLNQNVFDFMVYKPLLENPLTFCFNQNNICKVRVFKS